MKKKVLISVPGLFVYLFFVSQAFAHEAYVLPSDEFHAGLKVFSKNPLGPLIDPAHYQISAIITIIVILVYILCILWSMTKPAGFLDRLIKKAAVIGPLIIRLAVGTSFYFSASSNCFLGPELSLTNIAGGSVIRFLLFATSLMILLGVLTEVAAAISLLIFLYITFYFGPYMITYGNYLAEFIVLLLFGSRFLSFDYFFLGKKLFISLFEKYKRFEIPLVRIFYGIALIYAGFTIKFLHQDLSVAVYNQYHLRDFFHASGSFIAAGAGLSEIAIGLFILLGFAQRLTVLISLVFITLSLLYFREMLWPHLILYGISFSLLINSADQLTIDHYMIPWGRSVIMNFWQKLKKGIK